MHIPKSLQKIVTASMLFFGVLANDTLANTLNKEPTSIEQQQSMTPDQFYQKVIQKNYDHMELFKKVRPKQRQSLIRDDAYRIIIENIIDQYDEKWLRDDMDIIVLVFWGHDIPDNTRNTMLKRLAESQRPRPNIWLISMFQRRIKYGQEIQELDKKNSELDRVSQQLDEIKASLIAFKKVFDSERK